MTGFDVEARSGRPARARALWLALRLVGRSSPAWTIAGAVLALGQALLALLSLVLTKRIFDAAQAALMGADPGAEFAAVAWVVAAAGAVALVAAGARTLETLCQEAQALAVTDHVQGLLHEKSVEADLAYYENPGYHDQLHRAQQQAPSRPTRVVHDGLAIVRHGLALAALGGLFLISLSPVFAAALALASVPVALVGVRQAQRRHAWQRARTSLERRVAYYNWVVTSGRHAKELRLFGLGPWFISRSRDARAQLRREALGITLRNAGLALVAQGAQIAVVFGAFALLARSALAGAIGLGDLVMWFQALNRGREAFQGVLAGASGLYENGLFLSSLDEFLALEPRVREPDRAVPVPRRISAGVVFEGVGFRYPGTRDDVLHGIDLTIGPGEHVALVGENGAGKSTVIKLVCRLYDPSAGRITIDGRDLREFGTAELRREISAVFQDPVGYQLTARENVWLGDVERELEDPEVLAAARRAGADEVLVRLTRGYDTVLGGWFDDGVELSGGEWQRIALARAFLRRAQILVLDEPTSALDPRAECALFERLRERTAEQSAIWVSHRLSTVRLADRIYVLERGRIAECGRHDELIDRDGIYARLFERQARSYR